MSIAERATVAVFGVLLACIFGVLLAWVFLVTAVTVGTDDKGKTGASTEKIEILRARPVPITIPRAHFMLAGQDDHLSQRPSDLETGEQVKVLESHPVPIVPIETPDRFMLIGRM
jgi:hypothetical protein